MLKLENIQLVRNAVAQCGRPITVIAASKTQTSETVDDLMSVAPDFVLGENRVQELIEKYNPAYRWQLIGQLQTNKVKYIVDKVEMIHSLDRLALADEIEKQCEKHGIDKLDALVEINMGAEITKGGVEPENLQAFIRSLASYKHIEIKGLMAVLPNLGDTPQLRAMYARLKNLFDDAKTIEQSNVDIKYLSAGMTNDWQIALEYGSNMIRIGRLFFGERYYPTNA